MASRLGTGIRSLPARDSFDTLLADPLVIRRDTSVVGLSDYGSPLLWGDSDRSLAADARQETIEREAALLDGVRDHREGIVDQRDLDLLVEDMMSRKLGVQRSVDEIALDELLQEGWDLDVGGI